MFSKLKPHLSCDRINQAQNILCKFLPGDGSKEYSWQNKNPGGLGLYGLWLPWFA